MKRDWTQRLSSTLGLAPESQDWGIANASPDRLLEFIEFFEQHQPQDPWDQEALAELILASADEALRRGSLEPQESDRTVAFLRRNAATFPHQIQYWSNLPEGEFPVVRLLGLARQL